MSPRTSRTVLVLVVGAGLVGVAGPAPAVSPALLRSPGPVGSVDTLAGPGFCDGQSLPDPASTGVGAVAADPAGALWFEADSADDGLLTTVLSTADIVVNRVGTPRAPDAAAAAAGSGRADEGPASRLAADGRGGVFIAGPTTIGHLVRSSLTPLAGSAVPPSAGSAVAGSSGDAGPLVAARFGQIKAIAADLAGNVYVADEVDAKVGTIRVRFLNRSDRPVSFYPGTASELTVPPGVIDTIAGSAAGSSPLQAFAPVLAVADGRLYLAGLLPGPRPRAEVRMLNLGGSALSAHAVTLAPATWAAVTTVSAATAGAGAAVSGITVDDQGSIYLAEQANHRITRLDPAGTLTVVAGTGTAGFDGNDRPAVQTRLDRPYAVAVGAGGRLFISDAGNAQVRVVDRSGIIRTALGNGAASRWTCEALDGAPTRDAPLAVNPSTLAADAGGNVYLASSSQQGRVYRLAPSGGVRSVLAPGAPVGGPSPGVLGGVAKLAVGPAGALYLRDPTRVHVLNPGRAPLSVHGQDVAPGALVTVAGGGTGSGAGPGRGDGGRAVDIALGAAPEVPGLSAFTVDAAGNLLLADHDPSDGFRGLVRQVDPQGVITTLLEGPGKTGDGRVDITRCCAYINGLISDPAGNVYIAESSFVLEAGVVDATIGGGEKLVKVPAINNITLRRVWFFNRRATAVVAHGVTVQPGTAQLIAGGGTSPGDESGMPALQVNLDFAGRMALDGAGTLYVVSASSAVLAVDPRGTLSTVVGNGQPGFNGDELKATVTALDRPSDLAIDACGNLLIADSGNDRVRRLNLAATCPASLTATATAVPAPAGRSLVPVAALAGAGVLLIGAACWGLRRARRRGATTTGAR